MLLNQEINKLLVVRISLSSPSLAQQRLDLLLEQEAEFNNNLSNTSFYNNSAINTIPPAYSTEENNNNSSIPKYPTQAHISSELPTYDHATIDMPPSYGSHNNKDNEVAYDTFIVTNELPWPITKKLYIIGFVFWPLWLVGMGFSIFGKKNETRKWGRRCAWNSLIIMLVFAYMVVAYIRTNGRIVM
ncbi:1775_t:CDS:2 [Entrophospora sp. SA101]|nr:1775_t:CDS:2 [Entrophospora sp. SA101]